MKRVLYIGTYFLSIIVVVTAKRSFLEMDLCNVSSVDGSKPVQLKLDDAGELKVYIPGSLPPGFSDDEDRSGGTCKALLRSCDACGIDIDVQTIPENPAKKHSCGNVNSSYLRSNPPVCIPNCNHLIITEPAYKDVRTKYFLPNHGSSSFHSISSSLLVKLCVAKGYTNSDKPSTKQIGFQVYFMVDEKKRIISGAHGDGNTWGLLTSPNFPNGYAVRGEVYSYLIRNVRPGGFVRVTFDDWDLASTSRITFYEDDKDGAPLSLHFGTSHRPVIASTKDELYMTFQPDVGINLRTDNLGFRARYHFVAEAEWPDRPTTACGMFYKYSAGGSISMDGKHWRQSAAADCIWVVSKHKDFQFLQLRLENNTLDDNTTSLIIREGLLSDGEILADLSKVQPNATGTMVLNTTAGFYIRLQGHFYTSDYLRLVFTAFNTPLPDGRCRKLGQYLCSLSQQCIDQYLVCDKYIHCLLGDDEGSQCQTTPSPLTPPAQDCSDTEFACHEGIHCIPLKAVCDTWLDCPDSSDEDFCATTRKNVNVIEPTNTTLLENGKSPRHKSMPTMIISTTLTNTMGTTIPAPSPQPCEPRQTQCRNGNQCISTLMVCDGTYHCSDKSDEEDCATMAVTPKTVNGPPWNILMPIGIALCLVSFICFIVLCVRGYYKNQHDCGVGYASGRVPTHQRRQRNRGLRSVTSETPLTLNLSRSASCVTSGHLQDSPPSYDEALRLSPEEGSHIVNGFPGARGIGISSLKSSAMNYTSSTSEMASTSPSSTMDQTCFVFPSTTVEHATTLPANAAISISRIPTITSMPNTASLPSSIKNFLLLPGKRMPHLLRSRSEESSSQPICTDCSLISQDENGGSSQIILQPHREGEVHGTMPHSAASVVQTACNHSSASPSPPHESQSKIITTFHANTLPEEEPIYCNIDDLDLDITVSRSPRCIPNRKRRRHQFGGSMGNIHKDKVEISIPKLPPPTDRSKVKLWSSQILNNGEKSVETAERRSRRRKSRSRRSSSLPKLPQTNRYAQYLRDCSPSYAKFNRGYGTPTRSIPAEPVCRVDLGLMKTTHDDSLDTPDRSEHMTSGSECEQPNFKLPAEDFTCLKFNMYQGGDEEYEEIDEAVSSKVKSIEPVKASADICNNNTCSSVLDRSAHISGKITKIDGTSNLGSLVKESQEEVKSSSEGSPSVCPPPRTTSLIASILERGGTPPTSLMRLAQSTSLTGSKNNQDESSSDPKLPQSNTAKTVLPLDSNFCDRIKRQTSLDSPNRQAQFNSLDAKVLKTNTGTRIPKTASPRLPPVTKRGGLMRETCIDIESPVHKQSNGKVPRQNGYLPKGNIEPDRNGVCRATPPPPPPPTQIPITGSAKRTPRRHKRRLQRMATVSDSSPPAPLRTESLLEADSIYENSFLARLRMKQTQC